MSSITIGIVGYGEVGKIFAKGLQGKDGVAGICAWDVNFQAPAIAHAERAHADSHGVRPTQGMAQLCEQRRSSSRPSPHRARWPWPRRPPPCVRARCS